MTSITLLTKKKSCSMMPLKFFPDKITNSKEFGVFGSFWMKQAGLLHVAPFTKQIHGQTPGRFIISFSLIKNSL